MRLQQRPETKRHSLARAMTSPRSAPHERGSPRSARTSPPCDTISSAPRPDRPRTAMGQAHGSAQWATTRSNGPRPESARRARHIHRRRTGRGSALADPRGDAGPAESVPPSRGMTRGSWPPSQPLLAWPPSQPLLAWPPSQPPPDGSLLSELAPGGGVPSVLSTRSCDSSPRREKHVGRSVAGRLRGGHRAGSRAVITTTSAPLARSAASVSRSAPTDPLPWAVAGVVTIRGSQQYQTHAKPCRSNRP